MKPDNVQVEPLLRLAQAAESGYEVHHRRQREPRPPMPLHVPICLALPHPAAQRRPATARRRLQERATGGAPPKAEAHAGCPLGSDGPLTHPRLDGDTQTPRLTFMSGCWLEARATTLARARVRHPSEQQRPLPRQPTGVPALSATAHRRHAGGPSEGQRQRQPRPPHSSVGGSRQRPASWIPMDASMVSVVARSVP
jgi:hypothetical protein